MALKVFKNPLWKVSQWENHGKLWTKWGVTTHHVALPEAIYVFSPSSKSLMLYPKRTSKRGDDRWDCRVSSLVTPKIVSDWIKLVVSTPLDNICRLLYICGCRSSWHIISLVIIPTSSAVPRSQMQMVDWTMDGFAWHSASTCIP